jgi:hypothetical protein
MGRQIFAFSPPDGRAGTTFVSPAVAGSGARRDHAFGEFVSHSHGATTSFTTTLTDSAGTATGTATYSTHTSANGEFETTFNVSVTGATADTTFDLTVGDTVIGQLTTDDTGAGSLVLSSKPTGDEQELPAGFATDVGADTAISVGTLGGSLTAETDTGGGDSGDDRGGDHGGCHHSATDISLTTTSNSTGTQQALPSEFPINLSVGSAVTVGRLSGTLTSMATTTSNLHFGGLRFGRLR